MRDDRNREKKRKEWLVPKFKLEFEFSDGDGDLSTAQQIVFRLHRIAHKIDNRWETDDNLHDDNGNRIGSYSVTES